ncbi:MAG: TadE family protein [Acidimicrobiia bacterium]
MRSTSCGGRSGARAETGATLIEFLAVTILSVVCLLAIAQMAVWVWARNVAVSAVHEGARTAAERGRPLEDGALRTRTLLHDGLWSSGAGFTVDVAEQSNTVAVRARGTAPSLIPFLPRFDVEVQATAFDEDAVLR